MSVRKSADYSRIGERGVLPDADVPERTVPTGRAEREMRILRNHPDRRRDVAAGRGPRGELGSIDPYAQTIRVGGLRPVEDAMQVVQRVRAEDGVRRRVEASSDAVPY